MNKTKFKVGDKVVCSSKCPDKYRFSGIRVIYSVNRPITTYKKLNYSLVNEAKIYFATELELSN